MDAKTRRMRHGLFFAIEKPRKTDLRDALGLGIINQKEYSRLLHKNKYIS